MAEPGRPARSTIVSVPGPPRVTRVLPRGDWMDEAGEVVEPAVPRSLGPLDVPPGRRPTRLDLARWLVAPDNPLTARVVVNRLWKTVLRRRPGRHARRPRLAGRVADAPELLDWLAVEFLESGWDVKHDGPADRHLVGVPAVVAAERTISRRPTRRTASRAAGARSGSRPSSSATTRWRSAGCSCATIGGRERQAVPARRLLAVPQLPEARVRAERGAGPVPPRPLHPLAAHVSCTRPARLRRAQPRGVRRPAAGSNTPQAAWCC